MELILSGLSNSRCAVGHRYGHRALKDRWSARLQRAQLPGLADEVLERICAAANRDQA